MNAERKKTHTCILTLPSSHKHTKTHICTGIYTSKHGLLKAYIDRDIHTCMQEERDREKHIISKWWKKRDKKQERKKEYEGYT